MTIYVVKFVSLTSALLALPYFNSKHCRFGMETHLCGICWGWDIWPTSWKCACWASQHWQLPICPSGSFWWMLVLSPKLGFNANLLIKITLNFFLLGPLAGRPSRPIKNPWWRYHWCHSTAIDMFLSWTRVYSSWILCEQRLWWRTAKRGASTKSFGW